MREIESRNQLATRGVKGVGSAAAGVGLLVLKALSSVWWVGAIIGGALTLIGISVGTSRRERTSGIIVGAAGVLTLLSSLRIFPRLGGLMWVAGIGLLVAGGVYLYQFAKGIRKRS